jgi:hypothetical protein
MAKVQNISNSGEECGKIDLFFKEKKLTSN